MNTAVPPRVLVIEDNQTNRELMVYLLKAFGYRTSEAANGEAGLEAARDEPPDLIVCDVHMPKLDGYGVVRWLKKEDKLRETPTVAVTALALVGDRDRILAAGFDGYVSKPITPDTFVSEIEKYLPAARRVGALGPTREQMQPGASHEIPPSARQGSRGLILVVDDTAANIEFACTTLESSDFATMSAPSVEKAVALARKERPDLILSDLYMVPHDGFDFLDRARTDPALVGVPFIMISSTYLGEREAEECRKRGARFVRRPIEPRALLAEIEDTLGAAREGRR